MRRRSGFTITELLVAMALIVFIMSIIATAFSSGMQTFRALKGIGDMNQRMRTVASLLQDDLSAKHFEGDRRLSDNNFWTIGPPREGFFRVWQGSLLSATPGAPYYLEGTDIDYGLPSVRATDHILHFTSKKLGNDPKNFYRAAVPPMSPLATFGYFNSRFQDPVVPGATSADFTSQWAEIAWFMRGNGNNANGTPLFTLYRRQRVIVPNPVTGGTNLDYVNTIPAGSYNNTGGTGTDNYLNISCRVKGNAVYFNSPSDLTVPQYRFSMQPGVDGGLPATIDPLTGSQSYFVFQPMGTGNVPEEQTNPSLQGANAVITDVISFAVQVRTSGNFVTNTTASSGTTGNPLFAGANGPFVYDTWTTVTDPSGGVDYSLWNYSQFSVKRPPLRSIITGVQIQLRVWDNKTEQSRQMTIVVDM